MPADWLPLLPWLAVPPWVALWVPVGRRCEELNAEMERNPEFADSISIRVSPWDMWAGCVLIVYHWPLMPLMMLVTWLGVRGGHVAFGVVTAVAGAALYSAILSWIVSP